MVDKVLEEPWTEVYNIVQNTVFKTISKEKKCKMAKTLSKEALKIAAKRKGKIYPTECRAQERSKER